MLLLASASPRRSDLLKAAGIGFDVLPVNVDETPLAQESPEAHVRRLAEEKARVASQTRPGAVVLGADTVVVVDDRILGKPRDAADAAEMLRALSGRAHEVLTGVAVIRPAGRAGLKPERGGDGPPTSGAASVAPTTPPAAIGVACTRVWFSSLSDDEIDWYVRSGEPMDKAGAYAIQGLASRFIDRIDGSYSNVVGLPVALVYRLLKSPEIRHSLAV
jgi:septum formation protein